MGCMLAQDMTLECLFAKLSYLIGKVSHPTLLINLLIAQGYSKDRIRLLMNTSMRGELTNSNSVEEKFEFTNNDMILGVANYLNANDHEEVA